MADNIKKRAGKSTRSKRTKTLPREQARAATGRPPLDIDPETVEGMAWGGSSMEDVATFLEVDVSTIKRRFAPIFRKHKAGGRIKLNQAMLRTAIGRPARVVGEGANVRVIPAVPGNPTIQIFLSKQWLGYSDKVQMPVNEAGEEIEPQTMEIFGRIVRF